MCSCPSTSIASNCWSKRGGGGIKGGDMKPNHWAGPGRGTKSGHHVLEDWQKKSMLCKFDNNSCSKAFVSCPYLQPVGPLISLRGCQGTAVVVGIVGSLGYKLGTERAFRIATSVRGTSGSMVL